MQNQPTRQNAPERGSITLTHANVRTSSQHRLPVLLLLLVEPINFPLNAAGMVRLCWCCFSFSPYSSLCSLTIAAIAVNDLQFTFQLCTYNVRRLKGLMLRRRKCVASALFLHARLRQPSLAWPLCVRGATFWRQTLVVLVVFWGHGNQWRRLLNSLLNKINIPTPCLNWFRAGVSPPRTTANELEAKVLQNLVCEITLPGGDGGGGRLPDQ